MENESKKQLQVGRMLQREVSELFQRDLRELTGNSFVTVTVVRVSPNLGSARIYLSIILADNPAVVLKKITDHKQRIRQLLGNKIRNKMRMIPEIHFYLDNSAEYASDMDQLIAGLDIPPPSQDEEE